MALVDISTLAPEQRHDHAAAVGTPIIDARHVGVKFKVEHGTVDAVKDVSFQLYRGETIAVVGESGSGKSVTARTVMGLLTKRATVSDRSCVAYDGRNVSVAVGVLINRACLAGLAEGTREIERRGQGRGAPGEDCRCPAWQTTACTRCPAPTARVARSATQRGD